MYKTIEINYTDLETYLNKKWYTFLGFRNEVAVFKYNETTPRQIKEKTNTERFFELDEEWINEYSWLIAWKLWLEFEFIKQEIIKFRSYRLEKSEWAIKCKWQKQTSFEVPLRLQTWLSNVNKNNTNKKWLWITSL